MAILPRNAFFKALDKLFFRLLIGIITSNALAAVPSDKPVIAIIQFADHLSLDAERVAIRKALATGGHIAGENCTIIEHNAQGSVALVAQIAQQVAAIKPKVIIAIGTPAAQGMLRDCIRNRIPLVFTAVTDPAAAKLIGPGVTGVSDLVSEAQQIELVLRFMPKIKRLGVIYNPGEVNSVVQIEAMKRYTRGKNLTLILVPATKTAEVGPAAESALHQGAEAILLPSDNTVVSGVQNAVRVAEKYRIPLFASDFGSFTGGAVAAIGYERQELGTMAGKKAVEILAGKSLQEIPVASGGEIIVKVNPQKAKELFADFNSAKEEKE